MKKFDAFLDKLRQYKTSDIVFNPYFQNPKVLNNLNLYLQYVQEQGPLKFMLIGEAPGHLGCKLSGIPFTSTHLMQNSKHSFFSQNRQKFYISKEQREGSAATVWKAFEKSSSIPLLWNAFPFHPHLLMQANSNRTPTSRELEQGAFFMNELIAIFAPSKILAVGRKSEKMLKRHNISNDYVRHPARGGASQFSEQMDKLLN